MRNQFITLMVAAIAVAGCTKAKPDHSAQAKRVGTYLGSWMAYFPGHFAGGVAANETLMQTAEGRDFWRQGIEHSIQATSYVMLNDGEDLGDILKAGGEIASGDATDAGGSLPTAPATGGGTLPTSPGLGSGATVGTSPGVSGTLPTAPPLGSGTSVQFAPFFSGAGYSGSGSAGDYLGAICDFIEGFFTYFANCSENGDEIREALAAGGGCRSYVGSANAELANLQVSAAVITLLRCMGDKIAQQACVDEDDGGAFDLPIQNALSACGITVNANTGEAGLAAFLR